MSVSDAEYLLHLANNQVSDGFIFSRFVESSTLNAFLTELAFKYIFRSPMARIDSSAPIRDEPLHKRMRHNTENKYIDMFAQMMHHLVQFSVNAACIEGRCEFLKTICKCHIPHPPHPTQEQMDAHILRDLKRRGVDNISTDNYFYALLRSLYWLATYLQYEIKDVLGLCIEKFGDPNDLETDRMACKANIDAMF